METGLLGSIRWKLENGTLTFEPQNGNEGTFNMGETCLDELLDDVAQVKHIKTKGILHCEGVALESMFEDYDELRTADLSAFETSVT